MCDANTFCTVRILADAADNNTLGLALTRTEIIAVCYWMVDLMPPKMRKKAVQAAPVLFKGGDENNIVALSERDRTTAFNGLARVFFARASNSEIVQLNTSCLSFTEVRVLVSMLWKRTHSSTLTTILRTAKVNPAYFGIKGDNAIESASSAVPFCEVMKLFNAFTSIDYVLAELKAFLDHSKTTDSGAEA